MTQLPAPVALCGLARLRRSACAAVLLALAGGCTTPAMLAPDPDTDLSFAVPESWLEPAASDPGQDIAAYWQQLDDPLLSELVALSLMDNREIAARLDQARANLRRAEAGYWPTLSAGGTAARDIGDGARNGLPLSLGVDAAWELDLFGQISGGIAAARGDFVAQGYALVDLQRLIAGQAAIGTITARATAQQLAIARETLAIQQDNLQIARWRNQAGLVSSLDVEQARSQLAQTAATIPALEASLAASAHALSTMAGEPPGRVLAALQQQAAAVPVPPATAGFTPPAEVLHRRPDVRSAEAALFASTARIGVARAQMLPLVRLTGNIGTGPDSLGNLFDLVSGNLLASISQLIFDGGRTQAGIDEAEAAAHVAVIDWEDAILLALEEVETASAQRRSADQRVDINAEAVDAATNSALLARSQYQAGLTDFRNLLTAESQLLNARNQQLDARADRAIAFVRLTQALGGGWNQNEFDFPLPVSDRND